MIPRITWSIKAVRGDMIAEWNRKNPLTSLDAVGIDS